MKNGVALIAKERLKQIEKYGFTVQHYENNPELYHKKQLQQCAVSLLVHELPSYGEADKHIPEGWNQDWFIKMTKKPLLERLIIAGALIASEIDRIEKINQ
jgi:hypothetical protein